MNFVSQKDSHIVIRQIPFVLLFVTAIFGLIPFVFSLVLILGEVEADGKIFGLLFGLFMMWLFLEFVATRERIEIDLKRKTLVRTVSGVFRRKRQVIDLLDVRSIILEMKLNTRGRKIQYLYLWGSEKKHLLNTPATRISITASWEKC